MHLLGIDCDGLQTVAVLSDREGQVLVRGSAPAVDNGNLEGVVRAAIEPCIALLGPHPAVASLALPLSYPAPREKMQEIIRRIFPERVRVWLCSSMESAVAGALGGQPGVMIHSGVRAAALGVEPSGRVLTAGQAPVPLGDDGSALWLAVRILKLAVQGHQGRVPRSPRLEASLRSHFGVTSLDELVVSLDDGTLDSASLAGFVTSVVDMADYPNPEPACRVLVLQASRHLATLVRYVIERTRWSDTVLDGSWSGIALQGSLLGAFRAEATRQLPEVQWKAPQFPPSAGCLLLAQAGASMGQGPEGPDPDPTVERVDPDVWREAFKLNHPLPAWSEA